MLVRVHGCVFVGKTIIIPVSAEIKLSLKRRMAEPIFFTKKISNMNHFRLKDFAPPQKITNFNFVFIANS